MKLKLFSVLAGAISGWVLSPDNYTNPCEDFQVLFKGFYQIIFGKRPS